jgi:hypothetical protein
MQNIILDRRAPSRHDSTFGGTLPELYDAGDEAFLSFEIADKGARGHDRRTACSFTANVTDSLVQVYDHGQSVWFAYDVRTA